MEINNDVIFASFRYIDKCKVKIIGSVKDTTKYKNIVIIAPNTYDAKSSYSGKGLPFPCADIAFENTPNKYVVGETGIFDVVFDYPNSYYTVANKMKIVSPVYFLMVDNLGEKHVEMVELQDKYDLRTLINRESRNGPEFYSKKYDLLTIDTAESIMKQYSLLKKQMKIA
jgi:hypothetical protein